MSPVLGRPPRTPRSRPVDPGAKAPVVGKGTTATGKPTGARRATGLDEVRQPRGATRHATEASRRPQPRHTNGCEATAATGCRKQGQYTQKATNNGTRTGAREHQLPSGWTCAHSAANAAPAGYGTAAVRIDKCAPGSVRSHWRLPPSRRADGRVHAWRVPSTCRLRRASVGMDECAPRSDAPHTEHSTPCAHTGEQ